MSETNSITIILYQHSIMAKTLEKKLKGFGYNVTTTGLEPEAVESTLENTDQFILYFPKACKIKEENTGKLSQICSSIYQHQKNITVIGNKEDRLEILETHPSIANYEWISGSSDIVGTIERMLSSTMVVQSKKRILIVDDNPSYAGMVKEWLKEHYKVDIVTDGMQAAAFMATHAIDLILLDYEMPIMNGPQVFQMLRSNPTTKDIPVIFLTGVESREEVKQVLALKPDGYILKSTAKEKLLAYLQEKI